MAALAAYAGVIFQHGSLHIRGWFGRGGPLRSIPAWTRPLVGAVATWLLGIGVYSATGSMGVFGLGYIDLSAGLVGELAWQTAIFLLAAKLVATAICVGVGGAGGVFSPSLVFGGNYGTLTHRRRSCCASSA